MIDYRQAGFDDADTALCEFAVKLTMQPGAMGQQDVDSLRQHGFSDEAIVIAGQVVAYFNYINRIADGLGVDDEPWMGTETIGREDWHARKGHGYG
ncbi:MAG: peroxidase [Planctomycetes bacterium]|nr:peroxidase [Planctomycetota bacterium]